MSSTLMGWQNIKPWERGKKVSYQYIQISSPEKVLIFSAQTAKPALVKKALDYTKLSESKCNNWAIEIPIKPLNWPH